MKLIFSKFNRTEPSCVCYATLIIIYKLAIVHWKQKSCHASEKLALLSLISYSITFCFSGKPKANYKKKISAVKRLIAINRIQNKSFCLHNICMCTEYIYYVLWQEDTVGVASGLGEAFIQQK